MVNRVSYKGTFFGCSRFPSCRGIIDTSNGPIPRAIRLIPVAQVAEPPVQQSPIIHEVHYHEKPKARSNRAASVPYATLIKVLGSVAVALFTFASGLIGLGWCAGIGGRKDVSPLPHENLVVASKPLPLTAVPTSAPIVLRGAITPAQLKYLETLIEKRGWDSVHRDAAILRVTGHKGSLETLTKAEASRLIDELKQ